jgi:hypothetical protein
VASTLNDPLVEDANQKAARLHNKTMVYLDRLIDYLGG